MKKLLIGFLAVGLIMGFAMTASAQPNLKASGQLYMYGSYADNQKMTKDGDSRANIGNRLRMQFEVQVQEGLKLTTRFDALERAWGQNQVVGGAQAGEKNISWERAYVTFNALYGVFDVGYKQSRVWGTCAFCDDYDSDAGISYRYMMGPWTFGANWDKRGNWSEMKDPNLNGATAIGEGSLQSTNSGLRTLNELGGTDNDHDVYQIYGIYRWATGQAGLRFEMERDAANGKIQSGGSNAALAPYGFWNATRTDAWVATFYEIAPYVQWISGPFALEGEFRYVWGKVQYDDTGATALIPDVDRKGWDLYLMGKYTMGAFYGGLEFVYISGDDPSTADKNEAGQTGGGGWDPLLMFGNYWFLKYQGALGNVSWLSNQTSAANRTDANTFTVGEYETNMIMFKPFVGWKVNPQLEIVAQFAWLRADEKPRVGSNPAGAQFVSDDYGREFDIYATYKLYNNLSYTVGFGYFWTGDYFKGADASRDIDDNYRIMNALNFTF